MALARIEEASYYETQPRLYLLDTGTHAALFEPAAKRLRTS
jgi:hypothetical protein